MKQVFCLTTLLFSLSLFHLDAKRPDMYNKYKNGHYNKHIEIPKALKRSVIVRDRGAGMFSMFFDVAYGLWEYDQGISKGVSIDFGSCGLYYDQEHGSNWFEYYCEPITLGDQTGAKSIIYGDRPPGATWSERDYIPKDVAHDLISKYIRIKPHIMQKVEDFVNEEFSDHYVICVHYRGTDKVSEAPKVNYETVMDVIYNFYQASPKKSLKIFVATDEQAFLDEVIRVWSDEYVCYIDTQRSTNGRPIHVENASPYQSGEDAMVDMLLLSRGSILLRTSSNLSLWSTYFNPHLPVVELSRRHGR